MEYVIPFIEIIYRKKLEQHKSFNYNYFDKSIEIKNKTQIKSKWFCDTFNTLDSDYNMLNDIFFKKLIDDVTNEVKFFSKQYDICNEEKIKCSSSWINVSEYGNYQEYHLHPKSHFSAVYYVKVPKNSGKIVFRNHSALNDMYNLPVDKGTQASFDTYSIQPEEGEIIIFRSNLLHMVEKNLNNEQRVCISMNFRVNE